MKVVIPLAGRGTRLRPHTHSQPKPLVSVAGKPMLGHILDELAQVQVEEIIFVVGHLGDLVKNYVATTYPQYRATYVEQTELTGQSQAIYRAQPFVQGELLVIFADTIFKADLASLNASEAGGVLHLREVTDPSRFGVAVVNEAGRVVRLVEKPREPVSNLAVVGVYYFKDATGLFRAIENQTAGPGGEYYLADAISYLIEQGMPFEARSLERWDDCGTIPDLLTTNRNLLDLQTPSNARQPYLHGDSLVIPPVHLGENVRLERSVVGPHVSLDKGVTITDSLVRNSIIGEHARLTTVRLDGSLIGKRASVRGEWQTLNVGDDSDLTF